MLKVLLVVLILIMLPQGSEAQFIGIKIGIPSLQCIGGKGGGGIPNDALTFNAAYMKFNGAYMTYSGTL